jgi:hypothetical protein
MTRPDTFSIVIRVRSLGGDGVSLAGVATLGLVRGRGPLTASYREAMTQMAMGGAGESEANGVLHYPYHPLPVCKKI